MTIEGNYGLHVEEISEWKELNEFLEDNFFHGTNFVFRGQRCSSWELETSLDRFLKQIPDDFLSENIIYNHLNRFERALRGRRGPNPPALKHPNDLWALGQHYGLGTPLLDWSYSPYIALFFAFNEAQKPSSGKRTLWALDVGKVREISDNLIEYENIQESTNEEIDWECDVFEEERPPIIELVEPLSDDNPRIINQAGLFTRLPVMMTLDKWVQCFCTENYRRVLYKLIIPDDEREDIVWALEKMNIHSGALFPDISGASNYCNEMLSILAEKKKLHREAIKITKMLDIPVGQEPEV